MFKESNMAIAGLICFVVALIVSFAPYAFVSDAQEVAETMQGIGGTAVVGALILVAIGWLLHLVGILAGVNRLRLKQRVNWLALCWNALVGVGLPAWAIASRIIIV